MKSKYRNRRVTLYGITFASLKEAHRYQELSLLVKAGEISDLQLQVRFALKVKHTVVGTYIADFTYWAKENEFVVEDVKGFRTPIYRLKAKLMKAIYGIEILEI
ncbi:MAG: DUF1064 domain-containing protein [Patescibacteria group bacterium]|nr:DUF1064 domain-containing protein [Patescibacteria group bacterium]